MGWAKFWANFSQTHLAKLLPTNRIIMKSFCML
jgi:hypothetical protein